MKKGRKNKANKTELKEKTMLMKTEKETRVREENRNIVREKKLQKYQKAPRKTKMEKN